MRILLQTNDPQTKQRYLRATEELNRHRLTVVRSEAQILERAFREPFDAILIDRADQKSAWLLLLSRSFCGHTVLLLDEPERIGTFAKSVTYCFAQNADPTAVLSRIGSFLRVSQHVQRTETRVSAALQRIGVPVHLRGFTILKDAIRLLLACERPEQKLLIEDLYALIGKSHGCSETSIEHAMRHAVEAAWLRADVRVLESMFGDTVDAERAAPSNAGFLFTIADKLKMTGRDEE